MNWLIYWTYVFIANDFYLLLYACSWVVDWRRPWFRRFRRCRGFLRSSIFFSFKHVTSKMRLSGITMKQIRFLKWWFKNVNDKKCREWNKEKKFSDFEIIFVAGLQNWIESKVLTTKRQPTGWVDRKCCRI